jgi:hypothetical protein
MQGTNIDNVTIVGYGARLRMWRADYAKPPYTKGEWRAGLRLAGVRNVTVLGLEISHTGGDGITIGQSESALKGVPPQRWARYSGDRVGHQHVIVWYDLNWFWGGSESVVIRDVDLHDNYRCVNNIVDGYKLQSLASIPVTPIHSVTLQCPSGKACP